MLRNLNIVFWALWLLVPAGARAGQAEPPGDGFIAANDNRNGGGTLEGGVLTLKLVAEVGAWKPEGPAGRTLRVQAFREERGPLTIPGPLVRVPAGTEIRASIRNNIEGTTLNLFGMRERPATGANVPVQVPAGETREVRFRAGEPGTYHYWATTTGRALPERRDIDGQLGGAFVVDPPGTAATDRVLVIGLWRTPSGAAQNSVEIGTINGRSWPQTERFDHRIGDTVRWRIVNLSFDAHAMHLHGIHFKVLANGDGRQWRNYSPSEQPLVVTKQVGPGETFAMEWSPSRPGNWLFHCHMVVHMTPPAEGATASPHHEVDESGGMAGLVMGIRVAGDASRATRSTVPPRRFTLRMREEPNRYGTRPGYRMDVEGLETSRLGSGPVPGPVIVLTRGEPVEASLVNDMREPTAVHWHGIELDSYFDGVPGWGGTTGSITPAIGAGQTFTAKFTPPRAGTFIYHTHWHDESQLAGGLYGPLIVLEPGQRYDPATDHVIVAGYDGLPAPGQREPIALNGRSTPVPAPSPGPTPMRLRPDVPNRLRLINITPNNVALTFVLMDGSKPATWKPVAKDGADLPAALAVSREARQLVSVGETYDFEIQPTAGQRLWLEVRRGNGEWVAQALLQAF
jgi:FtsP/CotA-like multicopper oxidase with cupredoxin domain